VARLRSLFIQAILQLKARKSALISNKPEGINFNCWHILLKEVYLSSEFGKTRNRKSIAELISRGFCKKLAQKKKLKKNISKSKASLITSFSVIDDS